MVILFDIVTNRFKVKSIVFLWKWRTKMFWGCYTLGIFFSSCLMVLTRCYFSCLQHRRTYKVDMLAIETSSEFINFCCLFHRVNLAEVNKKCLLELTTEIQAKCVSMLLEMGEYKCYLNCLLHGCVRK